MVKNFSIYFFLFFASTTCWAQSAKKKSGQAPNQYQLSVTGDTLNRTDANGLRYGLWNVYHEARYGDGAFFEIGEFVNDRRHGTWRTYTKDGIIMLETNYYNGFKDGEIKYYDRGRLVCRGNFKALRTDVPYDTLLIEDPKDNSLKEKIVPTSLGSVRHGFWTYYKPPYNKVDRVEEYQVDELIYSHVYETEADSVAIQKRFDMFPHNSNRMPNGIWTLDRGKKAPRFTDFPANTKYVKPNPGKKKVKH